MRAHNAINSITIRLRSLQNLRSDPALAVVAMDHQLRYPADRSFRVKTGCGVPARGGPAGGDGVADEVAGFGGARVGAWGAGGEVGAEEAGSGDADVEAWDGGLLARSVSSSVALSV